MDKGYYIQLYSPHGLIRSLNPEIGRDKDTGGQVKYVLEMLQHLSLNTRVRKVDLFTRRIKDNTVSESYEQEIEIVNEKARIIRIPCGGDTYIQKELLWDHLDEFVTNTIRFINEEGDRPDVVHGHYADGNYLANKVSKEFGIPFLATGHSLGRNKRSILVDEGMSAAEINERFNMDRRITLEEEVLQTADVFIVSTQHIIDTQYAVYNNFKAATFEVIPPGVNQEVFYPFYRVDMPSFKMPVEQDQALYRVNSEIERFLFNPAKPLILSIGRADKRKNFETIIQSFGQDKELQAMANLAIFAGVRKDITQMPAEEQEILTNLLLLLDKYDLYGKMAIPKKNDPRLEVPEIYRIAARKKGVFVNATPGENFGLTIVEAAACGLPVIASPSGGPKEILEQCDNGILVNVEDPKAIAAALKKIIADQVLWEKYSSNGIIASNQLYSWASFADKYMNVVEGLFKKKSKGSARRQNGLKKKLRQAQLFVISDLDGTLVEGDDTTGLAEFTAWVNSNKNHVVFGVASGRNRYLTEEAFARYDLPSPDILICSAGSEIYYTRKMIADKDYESYINHEWKRTELEQALSNFPGIRLQEAGAQRSFKLSYYVDVNFDQDSMSALNQFLRDRNFKAKVLLTDNKFLDLLPLRASKGNAVRFLSNKWQVPLSQFITSGNGGNDIDMLNGEAKGIVVANYSPELEELKKTTSVYFAKKPTAAGVLEGIKFHLTANNVLTCFAF